MKSSSGEIYPSIYSAILNRSKAVLRRLALGSLLAFSAFALALRFFYSGSLNQEGVAFGVLVFLGLFLFCFFTLAAFFLTSMKSVATSVRDPLIDFSEFLNLVEPGAPLPSNAIVNPQFNEVAKSYFSFRKLWYRLQDFQKQEEALLKISVRAKLARQAAHDIRSPLTALYAFMEDSAMIPENRRLILRTAINRIQEIANNLMQDNFGDTVHPPLGGIPVLGAPPAKHVVSAIVSEVIAEKRFQYPKSFGVDFEFEIDRSNYSLFGLFNAYEFKKAISDLINESVESLPGPGKISVHLGVVAGFIQINIQDDGKNLREELESARGYAREALASWGGTLVVESLAGQGRKITLTLPEVSVPRWFAPAIAMSDNTRLIVVDDDPLIHWVWDNRFEGTKQETILHFSSPELLETFARTSGISDNDLCLVDFHYKNSDLDGFDLIGMLGIHRQSILVTGSFDDETVRNRSESLGIRILPKLMAGQIPLNNVPTIYH